MERKSDGEVIFLWFEKQKSRVQKYLIQNGLHRLYIRKSSLPRRLQWSLMLRYWPRNNDYATTMRGQTRLNNIDCISAGRDISWQSLKNKNIGNCFFRCYIEKGFSPRSAGKFRVPSTYSQAITALYEGGSTA